MGKEHVLSYAEDTQIQTNLRMMRHALLLKEEIRYAMLFTDSGM